MHEEVLRVLWGWSHGMFLLEPQLQTRGAAARRSTASALGLVSRHIFSNHLFPLAPPTHMCIICLSQILSSKHCAISKYVESSQAKSPSTSL